MPNPSDLLAVARLLLLAGPQPSTEAQLRRAVSTAYYAVFHMLLRAGADRFMGPGRQRSAGFGLLYRGYNHGRMRMVCERINVTALSRDLAQQLGRTAVSQGMRVFAASFVELQNARHRADYDPSASFAPSDAADYVDLAEATMADFGRIAPDEKEDILALTLVNPRA